MVKSSVGAEIIERTGRTGLGVACSEHNLVDPCVQGRTSTHWAGLQGYDQCRAGESPRTDDCRGVSEDEHLRVGGRVSGQLPLVMATGDDLAIEKYRSPYRYVAVDEGRPCLFESDHHRCLLYFGGFDD